MCRYSLFLALELAPAPGVASPVLGGDSAVLLRVRLKLEFGVCVVAAEPGVRDKTHAFSQKTRQ
jgi:hypothetical protein